VRLGRWGCTYDAARERCCEGIEMSCDKQSADQARNVYAARNPGATRYEADDWPTVRRQDDGLAR
jgi:hypothetical protein